jgi:hypothetical protein
MTDDSRLDSLYFIDPNIYNCPFCKRRHVSYRITSVKDFNWTHDKDCYSIFVKCSSCGRTSMHLTYSNIWNSAAGAIHFDGGDIDGKIFYSVPTSYYALDVNIPAQLRQLFTESEGCLKSNFLTGASACARKIVYELAVAHEAEGDDYETRIKSLKAKLRHVDETYFDTLLTIQQVTSEKVHEGSYDGWSGQHLRVILAALSEILTEIYVVPKQREEKRKAILALKEQVTGARRPELKPGTQKPS